MSKGGGAGKVYFVLYLAVVLELLIIIVERDEAEEHLHKRQKEAMRIVQSILSQMQSGAGTEGINTRPQDEITIAPSGVNLKEVMGADLKSYRKYIVEVGVTDVTSELNKKDLETEKEYLQRLEKLVKLANVEQIQYQIFYNPSEDPNNAPPFPNDNWMRNEKVDFKDFQPGQMLVGPNPEEEWEFLGLYELNLDLNETFNKLDPDNPNSEDISPVYADDTKFEVGEMMRFAPDGVEKDSLFYYSVKESEKEKGYSGADLQKRAFVVNFQPPSKAGWYKLRFFSRTNRILGVKKDADFMELDDESTVNIGTVQLSVGDLRKVQKELLLSLEKYGLPTVESLAEDGDLDKFMAQLQSAKEEAANDVNSNEEVMTNINLYGYIAKLLAPGQSQNFDQNRGNIEFNIRVITPEPQLADPVVTMPQEMASFDAVEPVFHFTISPYQDNNVVTGRVLDQTGAVVARINTTPADQVAGLDLPAPVRGGKREYRATIDKTLIPGKYDVELTHQLMGKQKTENMKLDIFKAGLTENSKEELERSLNVLAYYGYPLNLKVEPTSGGKIKANQFRLEVSTDSDNQRPPIEGLAIPQELSKKYAFTPDAREVTVRSYWIQPHTGVEVDLYPAKTFEIKQEEPRINTGRATITTSGPAQRVQVRIENVRTVSPPTGDEGAAAKVSLGVAGEPEIDIPGYSLAVEPQIEELEPGLFNIFFEIQGNLERGQTKIAGSFTINLTGVATNPINGVKSEASRGVISKRIDYTPDRMGGQRRRR